MGFDSVGTWDRFDAAFEAVAAIPGVFTSEEEKERVLNGIERAISDEKDTLKKEKLANEFIDFVKSATVGGLREALKQIPYLSSLFN